MSTVISVEHVSKSYRLGMIGGATLKEDFSRWWAKLRNKPDPLLKVGGEPHARRMGEQFLALDDVSFQVKEGEVFGIVGRNGAGKSTLLKILSQVTAPTTGEIKIKGRIASLLEVGTGFHPDLTGYDNIFLNGAILGMTKAEIRRKLDEIIAFSEIEEFINTPVKRYSSGMYVRLAFAVAAHLDPEILIIDEVLAVGDVQFQKKCVAKMGEVSKGGRTVLFVSHNLSIVSTLCQRALLLSDGAVVTRGSAEEVVTAYLQTNTQAKGEIRWDASNPAANNGRIHLLAARVLCDGKVTPDVVISKSVIVQYDFEVLVDDLNVCSSIHLFDKHTTCVLASGTPSKVLKRGLYQHSCVLPDNFLNDVFYSVKIILLTDVTRWEVAITDALSFVGHETASRLEYLGGIIGCLRPKLEWMEKSLNGPERRPATLSLAEDRVLSESSRS